MIKVPLNSRKLKASRREPEAGDIFCMLMPDDLYVFGRVIMLDPPGSPVVGSILVYLYSWRSEGQAPDMRELTRDRLLLPPIFAHRIGWTEGYWLTVAHHEVTSTDRLPRHCFRRFDGAFFDEMGVRLKDRIEPCGSLGLANYRRVDDLVSKALGIPLAPTETKVD